MNKFFEKKVRYLNRISNVENDVIGALSKINQIKYKISIIKNKNVLNSMKLVLGKSKINHLQRIKNIYQNILQEIKIFPLILKLKKNKYDYAYKHYILRSTNKKIIETIKTDIHTREYVNTTNKEIKIKIINNFLHVNEKKIKKINFKFVKCLKDLFRLKNKNYINLYLYFISINSENNPNELNKEYMNVYIYNKFFRY